MDLRALRAGLGAVCATAGFNAWDYSPDDPQALPAAVVGSIKEMTRLNRLVCEVKVGIMFYVSLSNPADATARLDKALSVGVTGSFIDALDAVTDGGSSPWRSCRFDSAGPYNRYQMPGGSAALAVEVVLELTA